MMSPESTFDPLINDSLNLESDPNRMLQDIVQNVRTLTIVLSITMVIALVGNLFLAFLITKMCRRRFGPVQILILHTCAADVLFALCTALPQMASTLTFPHFYGGDFICRLVKYLQLVPMYASPYLLVAISVDRYVAICKPLVALKWKYGLVHALAGTAWTAALLFSVPNIFNFQFGLIENTDILACLSQLGPEFERAWISVFVVLVWLLPSLVVAIMYILVCTTVWKSMKCPADSGGPSSQTGTPTSNRRYSNGAIYTLSSSPGPEPISVMRKTYAPSINHYKLKTVKLTMTIVVANFLLWAPFCIINIISSHFPEVEIDDIVATCIILVGNANSCVNPWIYVIFNHRRILEILCGVNPSRRSRRQLIAIMNTRQLARASSVSRKMTLSPSFLAEGRCRSRKTTESQTVVREKNSIYEKNHNRLVIKRSSQISMGSSIF